MRQPVIFFTHSHFFLYIILCHRNCKSPITVFQEKKRYKWCLTKYTFFFMPKSYVHFMSTKIFKILEALVTIDNSKNSTKSYKLVILQNVCILQHFSKLSSFFLHKFISRQSFILPNFLHLLKILILLVLLLR